MSTSERRLSRREFMVASGLALATATDLGRLLIGSNSNTESSSRAAAKPEPRQTRSAATSRPKLAEPQSRSPVPESEPRAASSSTRQAAGRVAVTRLIGPDTSNVHCDPHFASFNQDLRAAMLDPERMKNDGLAFWFHKTGQGNWLADTYFAPFRQAAAKANLLFGSYHFLESADAYSLEKAIRGPAGSPASQADHYIGLLQHTGGAHGIIGALDIEPDPRRHSQPSWNDTMEFINQWHKRLPRRWLLLYSYPSYWHDVLGNPKLPPYTALWMANYSYTPGGRDPWQMVERVPKRSDLALLQFTADAYYQQYQGPKAAGAEKTGLDFSVANTSWNGLQKLAGLPPNSLPHPTRAAA